MSKRSRLKSSAPPQERMTLYANIVRLENQSTWKSVLRHFESKVSLDISLCVASNNGDLEFDPHRESLIPDVARQLKFASIAANENSTLVAVELTHDRAANPECSSRATHARSRVGSRGEGRESFGKACHCLLAHPSRTFLQCAGRIFSAWAVQNWLGPGTAAFIGGEQHEFAAYTDSTSAEYTLMP